MSEYKKTIEGLINSKVSGYQIYKTTGISQGRISEFRSGKRKIEGMTLETAEKLYNYAMKLKED